MLYKLSIKGILVKLALIVGGASMIVVAGVASYANAQSDQLSWTSAANPKVDSVTDAFTPEYLNCKTRDVAIVGESLRKKACVVEGETMRLVTYRNEFQHFVSAIGFGEDEQYYKITNIGFEHSPHPRLSLIPGSDRFIVREHTYGSTDTINIIEKAIFSISDSSSEFKSYEINFDTSLMHKMVDPINQKDGYNLYSLSQNSKWLIAVLADGAVDRMNLSDYTTDRIAVRSAKTNYHSAIDNSGTYIALSANKSPSEIINVNGDCIIETDEFPQTECVSKDLTDFIQQSSPDSYVVEKFMFDISFLSDGESLSFKYGFVNSEILKHIILSVGTTVTTKLDYLAIGDSYSSGEGDTAVTAGKKHYTIDSDINGNETTGIPREKCHVSERSYPFLLKNSLKLKTEAMVNIACSGATISDMWESDYNYSQYGGQGGRLESSSMPLSQLQSQALASDIPGRIPQVDFVKKYQPKVVTLTAGGNDVHFADILTECVNLHEIIYDMNDKCDIANTDNGKAAISKTIDAQYDKLRDLYDHIQLVSPSTKVFAIGYPQFINGDPAAKCAANVSLDAAERSFVYNSVSYMNNIIAKAATDAGVKYVDIESSLMGKRLCDDTKKFAVTGLALKSPSEQQESFHPNSYGHILIHSAIVSKVGNDLAELKKCENVDGSVCKKTNDVTKPVVPKYFADSVKKSTTTKKITPIVPKKVSKSPTKMSKVAIKGLKKNSTATIKAKKKAVVIATLKADAKGSINSTITIPATVDPGYTTIVAEGETPTGEPIEIGDVTEVTGPDDSDVDEDGIPDAIDQCLYVQPNGLDVDIDGIDDACDDTIETSAQSSYRIRNGLESRGEQVGDLAFERDITKSEITGVSGDYDPDGDGWAAVASSRSEAESGVAANFWIDESNTPHMSVRTPDKGCVQYRPYALKRVQNIPGKRAVLRETDYATTCRSQGPSEDVDANNMPDNIQQLYRARDGVSALGEDSRKLYLERNLHSQEAKYKVSDYAPLDSIP